MYRDLLDRPRLQVSAHIRRIVVGADGKSFAVKPSLQLAGTSEQVFVIMSVVNVGRRPVLWQGWGGKYFRSVDGKSSFYVIGRDLPKMLQEGQTHSEFTELDFRPTVDNVKTLSMWDASGKHWKLSRKNLKELKREAREFQVHS